MDQKPASSEDYGQPFDQIKETKLPITLVPAKPLSLRPMTMSQVVKASSSSLPSKSSLITTNNKFTLLQPSDRYNTQPLKEQFPYYEKPYPIKILTIEKEWFKKDRKTLYKTIFPNTFHYIPINPQKTQKFYEFILVDTGSIELTHYRDSNTKQPSKSFSLKFEPQNYTYYDYQEAWNHILFLSPSPHSWFIWFRKGISLQFPKWF
ncbi:hypothetical protein AHAS_Ahas14G0142400 [Arachis hypogaea]